MVSIGVLSGIGLLLYALVMLFESLSYQYLNNGVPGAGFFPFWINLLLVIASVLYIIESIRKDAIKNADILPEKYAMKKILSLVAGLTFFCLTAGFLGFFVSGTILLLSMFIWDFKWPRAVLLSVVFMVAVYFIFQYLLKVSLPTNALGF